MLLRNALLAGSVWTFVCANQFDPSPLRNRALRYQWTAYANSTTPTTWQPYQTGSTEPSPVPSSTKSSRAPPSPIINPPGTGPKSTPSQGFSIPIGTVPIKASIPLFTRPPGTGVPQETGSPRPSNNATKPLHCGCKISAVGASVAWWFPDSILHATSTLRSAFDSQHNFVGYIAYPATTTFDAPAALTRPTLIAEEVYDAINDVWITGYVFTTLGDPPAATTSILSVTAVKALPTGIIDVDTADGAWMDPWPMPSVVVPGLANKTQFSASFGTPYIYIPSYAVISTAKTRNGSCVRRSSVLYNLSTPYYGNYEGSVKPDEQVSLTDGHLPRDFLASVPAWHARCEPLLTASVEMLVTVYIIYETEFMALIAHVEKPVTETGAMLSLQMGGGNAFIQPAPTGAGATLDGPTIVTRIIAPETTGTDANGAAVTLFDQVPPDASRPARLRPLVAHVESRVDITLFADASVSIATVTIGGTVLVATAAAGRDEDSGGNAAGLAAAIVAALGGSGEKNDHGGGSTGNAAAAGIAGVIGSGRAGGGAGSGGTGKKSGTGGSSGSVGTPGTANGGGIGNAIAAGVVGVFSAVAGAGAAAAGGAAGGNSAGSGSGGSKSGGSKSGGLKSGGSQDGGTGFATKGQSSGTKDGNTGASLVQHDSSGPSGSGSNAFVPVITIGSSTFVGNAATQFFLATGQTLTPGGVATISGTTVSLGPAATIIVINGATQTLAPPQITAPPVLLINDAFVTANAGTSYVIDGQTLTPGGDIVLHGTTISLGTAADILVVNGATLTRPPVALPPYTPITINGQVITAVPAPDRPGSSEYVIGYTTLIPGGPAVTTHGSTISLLASGAGIVINGATTTFAPTAIPATNAPLLTINGKTFTAHAGTTYVIDGHTLTPGGVVTVHNGTDVISLSPHATVVVIDGVTTTLFPATLLPASTTTVPRTGGRQSASGRAGAKKPALRGAASSGGVDALLGSSGPGVLLDEVSFLMR